MKDLSIIRNLRRLVAANRAARKARHEAEVALRFRVCERGGRLFILCNGTAIHAVPESRTADYLVADIEEARRAALLFESLAPAEGVVSEEQ